MRVHHSVPRGQRYSCQQCGWCCRGWQIRVEPAERDRLLTHDWSQDSPRLRGERLFQEQRFPGELQPVVQIAHLKGRCAFLEEDNRCLIHKVLGEGAKPFTCRRFPFLLRPTMDGVLVGADYACPAMIRRQGLPFSCDEDLLQEWLERVRRDRLDPEAIDPDVLLSPGHWMNWPTYLELEASLLETLAGSDYPVAVRWGIGSRLLSAMADWAADRRWLEQEEVADWLGERRRTPRDSTLGAVGDDGAPSLPDLPTLAPMIGGTETPHTPTSSLGSAAIGYALAVANRTGSLYLSVLEGWVDLEAHGQVDRSLDRPEFDDYLTRFLSNYLLRKSLLESPHLQEGWDYLGRCLALVDWYAAASAAMHERRRVEEADLVAGIQAVEKAYVP